MDLNKLLTEMRDESPLVPREEKLRETINGCKEVYFLREKERFLTGWEFLWAQFQYTRKRWWAFQGLLLLLAVWILPAMEASHLRVRSIGVIGCLFVVLIIPELWRNRESDSVQVEAACLYSLQQLYAARITLFGVVDLGLLTWFSFTLGSLGLTLTEVVAQFLLPVTVTACICFSLLWGRRNWPQTVSLSACLIWGGAWWLVAMNEGVYARVLPPVWLALFFLALAFLCCAVRKAVRTTNQYWEAEFA